MTETECYRAQVFTRRCPFSVIQTTPETIGSGELLVDVVLVGETYGCRENRSRRLLAVRILPWRKMTPAIKEHGAGNTNQTR